MKARFIYFEEVPHTTKTQAWACRNNRSGAELGIVKWYAPWRQFCFFPTVDAVYSRGCLADIEAFLVGAQGCYAVERRRAPQ